MFRIITISLFVFICQCDCENWSTQFQHGAFQQNTPTSDWVPLPSFHQNRQLGARMIELPTISSPQHTVTQILPQNIINNFPSVQPLHNQHLIIGQQPQFVNQNFQYPEPVNGQFQAVIPNSDAAHVLPYTGLMGQVSDVQATNNAVQQTANEEKPITNQPQREEEVQLLYVPLDTLWNHNKQLEHKRLNSQPISQQHLHHPFEFQQSQIPHQQQHHLPYMPQRHKQENIQQSQQHQYYQPKTQTLNNEMHYTIDPLQINNFYTPLPQPTTPSSLVDSQKFFEITTPKTFVSSTTPAIKKGKSHQPPLAMFIKNSNVDKLTTNEVINTLKTIGNVDVLDSPSKTSPRVFIGPSNLQTPAGYTKFELPYLSNINSANITMTKIPFFVAPLSYLAPKGFKKIPLPAPHVGSVVIGSSENNENQRKIQQSFPQRYEDANPFNPYQPREQQTLRTVEEKPFGSQSRKVNPSPTPYYIQKDPPAPSTVSYYMQNNPPSPSPTPYYKPKESPTPSPLSYYVSKDSPTPSPTPYYIQKEYQPTPTSTNHHSENSNSGKYFVSSNLNEQEFIPEKKQKYSTESTVENRIPSISFSPLPNNYDAMDFGEHDLRKLTQNSRTRPKSEKYIRFKEFGPRKNDSRESSLYDPSHNHREKHIQKTFTPQYYSYNSEVDEKPKENNEFGGFQDPYAENPEQTTAQMISDMKSYYRTQPSLTSFKNLPALTSTSSPIYPTPKLNSFQNSGLSPSFGINEYTSERPRTSSASVENFENEYLPESVNPNNSNEIENATKETYVIQNGHSPKKTIIFFPQSTTETSRRKIEPESKYNSRSSAEDVRGERISKQKQTDSTDNIELKNETSDTASHQYTLPLKLPPISVQLPGLINQLMEEDEEERPIKQRQKIVPSPAPKRQKTISTRSPTTLQTTETPVRSTYSSSNRPGNVRGRKTYFSSTSTPSNPPRTVSGRNRTRGQERNPPSKTRSRNRFSSSALAEKENNWEYQRDELMQNYPLSRITTTKTPQYIEQKKEDNLDRKNSAFTMFSQLEMQLPEKAKPVDYTRDIPGDYTSIYSSTNHQDNGPGNGESTISTEEYSKTITEDSNESISRYRNLLQIPIETTTSTVASPTEITRKVEILKNYPSPDENQTESPTRKTKLRSKRIRRPQSASTTSAPKKNLNDDDVVHRKINEFNEGFFQEMSFAPIKETPLNKTNSSTERSRNRYHSRVSSGHRSSADIATTTSIPDDEIKTNYDRDTGRRRGVWKRIRVRPTDVLEGAESQYAERYDPDASLNEHYADSFNKLKTYSNNENVLKQPSSTETNLMESDTTTYNSLKEILTSTEFSADIQHLTTEQNEITTIMNEVENKNETESTSTPTMMDNTEKEDIFNIMTKDVLTTINTIPIDDGINAENSTKIAFNNFTESTNKIQRTQENKLEENRTQDLHEKPTTINNNNFENNNNSILKFFQETEQTKTNLNKDDDEDDNSWLDAFLPTDMINDIMREKENEYPEYNYAEDEKVEEEEKVGEKEKADEKEAGGNERKEEEEEEENELSNAIINNKENYEKQYATIQRTKGPEQNVKFFTTTITSTTNQPPTTTTTVQPTSESVAFHKNLMKNVVYATSTSTKITHDAEICYRGRCIKTEGL